MDEEQREITQFVPKDLADPRTYVIPLGPVKKILEDRENDSKDLLQTYRDEIARLTEELDRTRKSIASFESYKLFKKTLSLNCPQVNVKLTILQCAERMRRGQCTGCLDRDAILKKLGAKMR